MQNILKGSVLLTSFAFMSLGLPVSALADTVGPIDFESYSLGTINGQDGWSAKGSAGIGCATYDEGVSSSTGVAGFGAQSFRISNAVTSGCFGDQAFSKSTVNEAGEAVAENGGYSGGIRQPHFEAQFSLAVIPGSVNDTMSISPDRGDGARMSYLRFENPGDGMIHVYFDDVTDPTHAVNADTFNETAIGALDALAPHTVKLSMDFVNGPDNDVVKVYLDGNLAWTGTSWEDYYRFDTESNPNAPSDTSRTVDSLLFRAGGTAVPANAGKGYLIDNLTLMTGPIVLPVPSNKDQCTSAGWKTLVDSNGHAFKNQGDCVSFVATKGKNGGSGK